MLVIKLACGEALIAAWSKRSLMSIAFNIASPEVPERNAVSIQQSDAPIHVPNQTCAPTYLH